LITQSNASASGLKFKKTYDIYKYPVLKFRWKVDNVYKKGDATTKDGDDYPLRVYIMFQYDPQSASFFDSVKYELAKSFYGEYPPQSAINYIWANKKQKRTYHHKCLHRQSQDDSNKQWIFTCKAVEDTHS